MLITKTMFVFMSFVSVIFCQSIEFNSKPEIFLPGIVSRETSEVKLTFSPDGKTILWGTIGRKDGAGGLDIWQSIKTASGWSAPKPVSFNTADNEFDPCFSFDGKTVYFFSNRPGGFGGDDLYWVEYDPVTNIFGAPVNMGSKFNTAGDEWGPSISIDGGRFVYCTNGFGGKGEHDIFLCEKEESGWSAPRNFEAINSPEDDFDPVILHDGISIIFTRKQSEEEAFLYFTTLGESGYTTPVKLSEQINMPGTWNFGSTINFAEENVLYYTTFMEAASQGKLDICRIKYSINK